MVVTYVHMNPA